MDADLKWVIGVAIAMATTFLTTLVATFRNLAGRISAGNRDTNKRIDEVKEKYVRRDDLDGHIQRLEGNVRDLREELRENYRQLLEAISRH